MALTGWGRFEDLGQVSSAATKWNSGPLDRFPLADPGATSARPLSFSSMKPNPAGERLKLPLSSPPRGERLGKKLGKSKTVKEKKFLNCCTLGLNSLVKSGRVKIPRIYNEIHRHHSFLKPWHLSLWKTHAWLPRAAGIWLLKPHPSKT